MRKRGMYRGSFIYMSGMCAQTACSVRELWSEWRRWKTVLGGGGYANVATLGPGRMHSGAAG